LQGIYLKFALIRRARLAHAAAVLASLNPDAVRARGYAIVRTADGTVVRDSAQLRPGDTVSAALACGSIAATVMRVETAKSGSHAVTETPPPSE